MEEGAITLQKSTDQALSGTTEAGLVRTKEEEARLSQIIDLLNQRFGTEFEKADQLYFEQMEEDMLADEALRVKAKANKLDTFRYAFEAVFEEKLIDRMDQNQEIFDRILEDSSFGGLVRDWLMQRVYRKMNEKE